MPNILRTLILICLLTFAYSVTSAHEADALANVLAPHADEAQSAPATTAPPAITYNADGTVAVPVPTEKAMNYYYSRINIWVVGLTWGALVPLIWCFGGFSAQLRGVAERTGKKWFFAIVLYWLMFSAISFFISLPLNYYSEFVNQHNYGLSNQTTAAWFTESLKGLAISMVMGALVLWVPYLLIRKSPTRWWLYTWLATIPFILLMLIVQPIFLDPLFNKFGPMKNQALEQKILALAERAGIENSRVFEVDKSKQTKRVNAYVTGIGEAKRVVLWDTLIAQMTEPQTLFVMGHEMGHYVLNHVWKSLAVIIAGAFLQFYLLYRFANAIIARYGTRLGFQSVGDVASLPLLMLLMSLMLLVASPALNTFSRMNEHQSDIFGLEITRDNKGAAEAFVRLAQGNLGNPRPHWFLHMMRGTHPTLAERIEFANTYRPWEKGEALRYGELMKAAAQGSKGAKP
jgi:STE24 endopeptidase